ncbi:hypothetical protein ACM6Q7_21960 [Peribacillus butanolivorans]|uniref:hypothetical protein n=1 Tax=Peribacillus butanolivorans TaxID=421767 RepID=UPI0039FDDC34
MWFRPLNPYEQYAVQNEYYQTGYSNFLYERIYPYPRPISPYHQYYPYYPNPIYNPLNGYYRDVDWGQSSVSGMIYEDKNGNGIERRKVMEITPELIAAVELAKWPILALPGVVGIGIGIREENGVLFDDELAIRVHVSDISKVPPGIPEVVGSVVVCIIESNFKPYEEECCLSEVSEDISHQKKIVGGIRIINPNATGAGTLGAVVKDSETGELLGLSNAHVVKMVNDMIWQPDHPPLVHGGGLSQDDLIGRVERIDFPHTQPLPFSPVLVGLTDAGVFKLGPALEHKRDLSPAIIGQNAPDMLIDRITATALPPQPLEDLLNPLKPQVRKRGFRTRLTEGRIIESYMTYQWTAGPSSNMYLIEQSCIEGIRSESNPKGVFACRGDSGSVVLDINTPTAVGLLWGGSDCGTRGIMSQIRNVESQLKVNVVWQ